MKNQEQPPPVTTISENPPSSEKSFSGKRNWKKWMVIYVAIAAVIYGGIYFFLSQQANKGLNPYSSAPTKSVQPTQVQDEMANWKTYTNTNYNFSIKYPQESIIESNNAGEEEGTDGLQISLPISKGSNTISTEKIFITFITIYRKNQQEYDSDLEDAIAQPGRYMTNFKIESRSKVNVEGANADRVITYSDEQGRRVAVYLVHENKEYYFWGSLKNDSTGSFLQMFDQILSTFKFTQ